MKVILLGKAILLSILYNQDKQTNNVGARNGLSYSLVGLFAKLKRKH